jgi:uncharacterized protein YicC (UPF0701 family)
MSFSILDVEFNHDFYNKNMRLNSSNEALPMGFKRALQKWIQSRTSEGNAIEAILLDSHYKFERIDNIVSLLDVINKEQMTSFLHDNAIRKIAIVCATHIIKDNPRVWTGLD